MFQQFLLLNRVLLSATVVFRKLRQSGLQADEVGASAFAVVVEPVREDEPERVVVGALNDRLEKPEFRLKRHQPVSVSFGAHVPAFVTRKRGCYGPRR